jgi:hypothetical protein
MARTDAASIAAIIEVDDSIDLTPFIDAANELVTECCLNAGYTDTRLKMIETWLAAHFYTTIDPRSSSESVGGAISNSYQSAVTYGFSTSHYGQQAMRLDSAGGLAALDKKILSGRSKVSVKWLGSDPPDGEVF